MKICITGGSGFIGKQIINCNKDHKFVNINRHKIPNNISQDVLIHLAGMAHNDSSKSYDAYLKSNYELTKKIFDIFLVSKCRIFIFISTSKVYGEVTSSKNNLISEDSVGFNLSNYAKSKKLAEEYILSVNTNKKVYVLRPSVVYGESPKGNLKLLHNLIRFNIPIILPKNPVLKDLTDLRNLNFILKKIFEQKIDIDNGIYNICDPKPNRIDDILKKISTEKNKYLLLIYLPNGQYKKIMFILNFFMPNFIKKLNNLFFVEQLLDNSKMITALKSKLPYNSV